MTIPGVPSLEDWPFGVVAPDADDLIWADRSAIKRQLDQLLLRWGINDQSSLVIMWANFGAGKTHSLRYLSREAPDTFLTSYAALPQSVTSFVDIYKAILDQLDLIDLTTRLASPLAAAAKARRTGGAGTDAIRALWSLRTSPDGDLGALSQRWLRGERLTASQRGRIGVSSWIKGNDEAVQSLSAVVALARAGGYDRFVLLLDEFQRVGELTNKNLVQVNQGLHTLYNSNPRGLSIVLSMSFGRAENVRYHLTEEVRSRADPQQLRLDNMTADDAAEFVSELLAAHRPSGQFGTYEPFSKAAVERAISLVESGGLTPRRLMQALGLVLMDAIGQTDGAVASVSLEDVEGVLGHSQNWLVDEP